MDVLNLAVVLLVVGIWAGLLVGVWFWFRRLIRRLGDPRWRSFYIMISMGVGILMLMVALGAAAYSFYFIVASNRAPGTIVEIVEREHFRDGNRSVTYSPRVRFETFDGEEVVFVTTTSSYPSEYVEGEVVQVLYHPTNLSRVRVDRFVEHWLLPIFFGGFGAAWLIHAFIVRHWSTVLGFFRATRKAG